MNDKLDFIPKENPAKYMKLIARYRADYYDEWLIENAHKYGYIYERGKINV
jgi:hypothetical protein